MKPIVHRGLLDCKTDIPFPSAQIVIHQPSINEIQLIGETTQIIGANAITKDYQNFQDNSGLENLSNFDILMKIISSKTEQTRQVTEAIQQLFVLLFPTCQTFFTPSSILLKEEGQMHMIDNSNFEDFRRIIYDVFCLAELHGENVDEEYNPAGDRARALVEKFRKKREYLAELRKGRGENKELISLYGRYINILAVGEHKDKNVLSNYSVYQLVEEFKRFQLKESFDFTYQAKLAGATKIKDPKDWMADMSFGSEEEE